MPEPPADRPAYPWTWYDLIVLVGCGGWYLLWFNRYLSPATGAGGELFVLDEFEAGRMPYRDYFLPVPPGLIIWTGLFGALVGKKLIAFWVAGLVLRVAGAMVLHRWLLRLAGPRVAALATVAACVGATGEPPDSMGLLNGNIVFLGVFLGFALTKAWERPDRFASRAAWLVGAGATVGAALLLKQTFGVIVPVGSLAAYGYARGLAAGVRRPVTEILLVVAVAATVVAAAGAWLWYNGVLDACIRQVFVGGANSKGGLGLTLARPFQLTVEELPFQLASFTAFVLVGWVVLARAARPQAVLTRRVLGVWTVCAAGWVALLEWALSGSPFVVSLAGVYAGYLGCGAATVWAIGATLRGDRAAVTIATGLAGAVGLAAAFSHSLSWPANQTMLVPTAAIALALALELEFPADIRTAARTVLVLNAVGLVALTVPSKLAQPSNWGFWSEPPVRTSTASPLAPELSGFRTSPETAAFLDEVTAIARTRTAPDDRMFVYPNMPILYGLAGRRPTTFAVMHWIDFCPDEVTRTDAVRLAVAQPKMIVYLRLPDAYFDRAERQFRAGERCGQRDMQATLDALVAGYEKVAEFGEPVAQAPITVWVRKDAPVSK